MTTGEPLVTAGTACGKITTPVTGWAPPEPSRVPVTPARVGDRGHVGRGHGALLPGRR